MEGDNRSRAPSYTIGSIFRQLFADDQVAMWLLSSDPEPPTSLSPEIMKFSVTADQDGMNQNIHSYPIFRRLDSNSARSGSNNTNSVHDSGKIVNPGTELEFPHSSSAAPVAASFPSAPSVSNGNTDGTSAAENEKLVFVSHGTMHNVCFMTMTDSRSPFSFLESPSTAVPGVRRAVAMCTDNGLVLAMYFWLMNGRSVLAFFKYAIDSKTPAEKHLLLLAPYPTSRYPLEGDVIESCVAHEQRMCQFCQARGLSQCECSENMAQRYKPMIPLQKHVDPWSLWSFLFGNYEAGMNQYLMELKNHPRQIQGSARFVYMMRPTCWNGNEVEDRRGYQHYLASLTPYVNKKMISWGQIRYHENEHRGPPKKRSHEQKEEDSEYKRARVEELVDEQQDAKPNGCASVNLSCEARLVDSNDRNSMEPLLEDPRNPKRQKPSFRTNIAFLLNPKDEDTQPARPLWNSAVTAGVALGGTVSHHSEHSAHSVENVAGKVFRDLGPVIHNTFPPQIPAQTGRGSQAENSFMSRYSVPELFQQLHPAPQDIQSSQLRQQQQQQQQQYQGPNPGWGFHQAQTFFGGPVVQRPPPFQPPQEGYALPQQDLFYAAHQPPPQQQDFFYTVQQHPRQQQDPFRALENPFAPQSGAPPNFGVTGGAGDMPRNAAPNPGPLGSSGGGPWFSPSQGQPLGGGTIGFASPGNPIPPKVDPVRAPRILATALATHPLAALSPTTPGMRSRVATTSTVARAGEAVAGPTSHFANIHQLRAPRGRRPSKKYTAVEPDAYTASQLSAEDMQRINIIKFIEHLDNMQWNPETREKCQFCVLEFTRKYDLKRHVRAVHLVEREHRCEDCGSQFKRRQHLDAHVAQVHQKTVYNCPYCDKAFISEANRRRHVRSLHQSEDGDDRDGDGAGAGAGAGDEDHPGAGTSGDAKPNSNPNLNPNPNPHPRSESRP